MPLHTGGGFDSTTEGWAPATAHPSTEPWTTVKTQYGLRWNLSTGITWYDSERDARADLERYHEGNDLIRERRATGLVTRTITTVVGPPQDA